MNYIAKQTKNQLRQAERIANIANKLSGDRLEQFLAELDESPRYDHPMAHAWMVIHTWELSISSGW